MTPFIYRTDPFTDTFTATTDLRSQSERDAFCEWFPRLIMWQITPAYSTLGILGMVPFPRVHPASSIRFIIYRMPPILTPIFTDSSA